MADRATRLRDSPHLSCKRNAAKLRVYMNRWVDRLGGLPGFHVNKPLKLHCPIVDLALIPSICKLSTLIYISYSCEKFVLTVLLMFFGFEQNAEWYFGFERFSFSFCAVFLVVEDLTAPLALERRI